MDNNPYIQFYKAGELDYRGAQIYKLKIDDNFLSGASYDTLTFDLDDGLIEELAQDEIAETFSQSQSSALARPLVDLDDPDDIDLQANSQPSPADRYNYVDDEDAYSYEDGTDCCYDYFRVRQAMSSFSKFQQAIPQPDFIKNQVDHFNSFLDSSKSFLQLSPLPMEDHEKWKTTYCQTFKEGTFIQLSVLSRPNDYNFNFPAIDRTIDNMTRCVKCAETNITSSSEDNIEILRQRLEDVEAIKSRFMDVAQIIPEELLTKGEIKKRDAEIRQLAADRRTKMERERMEGTSDEEDFCLDDAVALGNLTAIKAGK
jgi:hypothetical protein